ncbi:MAG: hypothetical protein WCL50_04510 [Spirochaetota bacterium]
MDDEALEYWKTFESETGEKVEARGMGALHGPAAQGMSGTDQGTWGLLVLTDRSFRFRHIPSQNWLSSMFKSGNRKGSGDKPFEIVIAREDLLGLSKPSGGFLARILRPPYPHFFLRSRGAAGEETSEFSVDSSGGFLKSLETAVARKA